MTTFSAPPFRLSDQERLDAMRLARTPGVGPINFSRLLCQYGSPTAALSALPERMRQAGRLDLPVIPSANQMADEVETLRKMDGNVLIRGGRQLSPDAVLHQRRSTCALCSGRSS